MAPSLLWSRSRLRDADDDDDKGDVGIIEEVGGEEVKADDARDEAGDAVGEALASPSLQ
jgi:hypothetical protein